MRLVSALVSIATLVGCASLLDLDDDDDASSSGGPAASGSSSSGETEPGSSSGEGGSSGAGGSSSGRPTASSSSGQGGSSGGPGCAPPHTLVEGVCEDRRVWVYGSDERASNAEVDDRFGSSLALSADGTTMAVGAYQEDSGATSIGGSGTDNTQSASGAVYVFRKSGGAWQQQAYLKTTDSVASAYFGWSLALADDGNTLVASAKNPLFDVLGAPDRARVYVFSRNGATWQQDQVLRSDDTTEADQFGQSVAVSGDGKTIAVGAIGGTGAVYVYTHDGGSWIRNLTPLVEPHSNILGSSVALSRDGRTLVTGDPSEDGAGHGVGAIPGDQGVTFSGAVSMYTADETRTAWTRTLFIKASNATANAFFGRTIALSADASTIAVGAPREATPYSGVTESPPDAGAPLAESGAAYVYRRSGDTWTETFVKATNARAQARFGESIALSKDGSTLLVGSPRETSNAAGVGGDSSNDSEVERGAAYVYSTNGSGRWVPRAYLKPNALGAYFAFGTSVAVAGDEVAVGATESNRATQPYGTVTTFRVAEP